MTAIPPVRRRIVGATLRRYREDLGYSLEDAARILECDRSKVSRIETGQRGIRSRELHDLLTEYRVEQKARETLTIIANPSGARRWRQPYDRGLPNAYGDMIALETAASHIMVYETQEIPNLLQCDEYAHALAGISADPPPSRLPGKAPGERPQIAAVIGETALRYMPGGPQVRRTQFAALESAGRLPGARVQVLLSENRAHAGRGVGSFTILRYAHVHSLRIVCLRGISGGIFVEDQQEITAYESAFRQLSASALPPDASAALIRQMQSENAVIPPV